METSDLYSKLESWPRYENDPAFRRWIDSGEYAPDYTFAWQFRKTELAAATA